MTTVREAVFDLFRTHGLTTIFGNPGSTELPMLNEFPSDFRYILGLQEAVVVGMADGYSQATGRPALVNLHTSAGVGNAMGAIINAAANRTPLIVTAGQQVRAMMTLEALLANVDAVSLPRPAVKWSYEPPRPQDVTHALARAIHIAQTPPMGPVFVSLPMDDFDAEIDAASAAEVSVRRVASAPAPRPEAIIDLADRLDHATNPVLITGGDVDWSGGWDASVALAERCRLPVWAAPLEGRAGFPQDHPNFRGFLPPAIALLSGFLTGHDLIVVAGAPVFRYYPYLPGAYLPDGAALVHLTSDPGEAAKAPVGDAIVGDVRLSLEGLVASCAQSSRQLPEPRPAPAGPEADTMTPVEVFATLAKAVPASAIWVNESPSNSLIFQDQVRINRPGSFFFTAGGGLGFGLPAAVGAQLGNPDRPVVAVMGDGSTQYAIPAFWSAAAYGVPVTWIVLTNREYAILKWFGQLEKVQGIPGLDIPGIDICSIASGYGLDNWRVTAPGDLDEAVRAAVGSGRPTVIDVPITTVLPTV